MRVLYVSQYFVTGDQPGGVRHWHHARALAHAGHSVAVVTSYVQHKERTVPERYRGRRIVRDREDGLEVFRTYATPGYGRDLRSRLINYLSFAWWGALAALQAPRPDVVLATSPSLPAAAAAALVATLRRAGFVLEVRDLWPDSAIAMGLVREGGLLAWVARRLECYCYRRADRVVALTEGIVAGVLARGVNPARVHLIPNGVDPDGLVQVDDPHRPIARREEVPANGRKFTAMYIGAHGTYGSLETILGAAEHMREEDVRFVLVGGGDRKAALVADAERRGLDNVTFVDPVPKREVPGWLSQADVCVLPYQDRPLFAGALPNKAFDYLGAGKPVVVAAPKGELSRLVARAGCGISVPPENPAALAEAVRELAAHPVLAEQMGAAGARYVRANYDRRVLAERLVRLVEGL